MQDFAGYMTTALELMRDECEELASAAIRIFGGDLAATVSLVDQDLTVREALDFAQILSAIGNDAEADHLRWEAFRAALDGGPRPTDSPWIRYADGVSPALA